MPPPCKMPLQGIPGQGEGRREGEGEGGGGEGEGTGGDLPEHPPSGMTAVMATAAMWERSSCGQMIIFLVVIIIIIIICSRAAPSTVLPAQVKSLRAPWVKGSSQDTSDPAWDHPDVQCASQSQALSVCSYRHLQKVSYLTYR